MALETAPGRIEAIVLRPRRGDNDAFSQTIDAALREANANLGPNQRIAGWRAWPDEDFPRTHTLKVKRDPVRDWAAAR